MHSLYLYRTMESLTLLCTLYGNSIKSYALIIDILDKSIPLCPNIVWRIPLLLYFPIVAWAMCFLDFHHGCLPRGGGDLFSFYSSIAHDGYILPKCFGSNINVRYQHSTSSLLSLLRYHFFFSSSFSPFWFPSYCVPGLQGRVSVKII